MIVVTVTMIKMMISIIVRYLMWMRMCVRVRKDPQTFAYQIKY